MCQLNTGYIVGHPTRYASELIWDYKSLSLLAKCVTLIVAATPLKSYCVLHCLLAHQRCSGPLTPDYEAPRFFWGSRPPTGGKPRPSARVGVHLPHQQVYVDKLVNAFCTLLSPPKARYDDLWDASGARSSCGTDIPRALCR